MVWNSNLLTSGFHLYTWARKTLLEAQTVDENFRCHSILARTIVDRHQCVRLLLDSRTLKPLRGTPCGTFSIRIKRLQKTARLPELHVGTAEIWGMAKLLLMVLGKNLQTLVIFQEYILACLVICSAKESQLKANEVTTFFMYSSRGLESASFGGASFQCCWKDDCTDFSSRCASRSATNSRAKTCWCFSTPSHISLGQIMDVNPCGLSH